MNLAKIDKENEYFLFSVNTEEFDQTNFKKLVFKSSRGQIYNPLWTEILLPLVVMRNKIDLLHSAFATLPFLKTCPSVITIHGLALEGCPEDIPIGKRLFLKASHRFASQSAAKIIVPSTRIKEELIRIYGVAEEKIEVIYEAAEEVFRLVSKEKAAREVKRKYGIKGDFILHVGILRPRKNVLTLLKAFNKLRSDYGSRVKLVLVGRAGFKSDNLFRFIADQNLSEEVIHLNYIPDKDLMYLYNATEVLVFPSLYEGFGLPAIEAMACGTPVLASKIQPMLEIIGDGGLFLNPHDVTGMSEKIYNILTDSNLRLELSEKALVQSRNFSWKTNAEKTLKIFYEVYSENHR